MPFVWDTNVSDIENARRHVEYIIQSIENHNANTTQVSEELTRLRDSLRGGN